MGRVEGVCTFLDSFCLVCFSLGLGRVDRPLFGHLKDRALVMMSL